jgi:hypothetical protein
MTRWMNKIKWLFLPFFCYLRLNSTWYPIWKGKSNQSLASARDGPVHLNLSVSVFLSQEINSAWLMSEANSCPRLPEDQCEQPPCSPGHLSNRKRNQCGSVYTSRSSSMRSHGLTEAFSLGVWAANNRMKSVFRWAPTKGTLVIRLNIPTALVPFFFLKEHLFRFVGRKSLLLSQSLKELIHRVVLSQKF